MTETKHIETKANCTLIEKEGRFVMTNETTGSNHSISSREDITSPERLKAHWEGFLFHNLEAVALGDLSANKLKEGIAKAKEAAIDQGEGGDFCDASGQIVLIDKDGERIHGGPLNFFTGVPSVKAIRKMFATHPEAVSMSIEGETRWYGEGNVVERRENAEPCDWWTMEVVR